MPDLAGFFWALFWLAFLLLPVALYLARKDRR